MPAATTLRDDLGRTVTLAGGLPVRRIVSLAPAVTENLFAIGAGALAIGGTTADDYPAEASRIARVGNFYQPSVERIRALRPDVILVDSATATKAAMDDLQARLHAPVFAQKSVRYDDVARHLEQLGRLTGKTASAVRAAREMQAVAARVARRMGKRAPVTAFVQIFDNPLYAAGPGSFVDDLLRRAGGVNVVRGANPFPVVSKESVLAANPRYYIIARAPGASASVPPVLRNLPAVREKRLVIIDADLLTRPTPRLARGLEVLAAALKE